MTRALSELLVRRRWLLAVAAVLLLLAAAAGIPRLTFSNDYRVFFSAENPHLRAF